MMQITRGLAKRMYNNGEEVMIIPNRIRTDSLLATWYGLEHDSEHWDFDKLCDAIFYYNCSPETGMKLAFYAKEASV